MLSLIKFVMFVVLYSNIKKLKKQMHKVAFLVHLVSFV